MTQIDDKEYDLETKQRTNSVWLHAQIALKLAPLLGLFYGLWYDRGI